MGRGVVFSWRLRVAFGLALWPFAALGLWGAGPPSSPSDLVVTPGDPDADAQEEVEAQDSAPPGDGPPTANAGTLVSWSGFEYAAVDDAEGQPLGVVEELLVDLREGRVAFASVTLRADADDPGEGRVLDASKLRWTITGPGLESESAAQSARVRAQLEEGPTEDAMVDGDVATLVDSLSFLSLSDLVAQIKGVTEGGDVQLVDCLVDLNDELAVIFQLQIGSSGSGSFVYASKLDWGGMQ